LVCWLVCSLKVKPQPCQPTVVGREYFQDFYPFQGIIFRRAEIIYNKKRAI
jgi:hypothetical protein